MIKCMMTYGKSLTLQKKFKEAVGVYGMVLERMQILLKVATNKTLMASYFHSASFKVTDQVW